MIADSTEELRSRAGRERLYIQEGISWLTGTGLRQRGDELVPSHIPTVAELQETNPQMGEGEALQEIGRMRAMGEVGGISATADDMRAAGQEHIDAAAQYRIARQQYGGSTVFEMARAEIASDVLRLANRGGISIDILSEAHSEGRSQLEAVEWLAQNHGEALDRALTGGADAYMRGISGTRVAAFSDLRARLSAASGQAIQHRNEPVWLAVEWTAGEGEAAFRDHDTLVAGLDSYEKTKFGIVIWYFLQTWSKILGNCRFLGVFNYTGTRR